MALAEFRDSYNKNESPKTVLLGAASGGKMHVGSALLVVWLIIGAVAAGQRHYYSDPHINCNKAATIAVTIAAGPLNYLGVNPRISCKRLQPSK